MFGKNSIAGRATFRELEANQLLVTSIFYTIQGEGPFSGEPALFVRLAKCNLSCSFCDTFFDEGTVMTFDEIFSKAEETITNWYKKENLPVPVTIRSSLGFYKILLVVTGGEPLLQSNLTGFCMEAEKRYYQTQIESNGIPYAQLPDATWFIVSPKCKEKAGVPVEYLKPSIQLLERANSLKFVMSSDLSSPYSKIPDWALAWAESHKNELYVSPMNIYNDIPSRAKLLRATKNEITMLERSTVDEVISFWEPGLLNMEKNRLNHEYTAKYAMQHGLTLSLQTHLYASLA